MANKSPPRPGATPQQPSGGLNNKSLPRNEGNDSNWVNAATNKTEIRKSVNTLPFLPRPKRPPTVPFKSEREISSSSRPNQASSPVSKSCKPQHFLQGIELNDSQYNVMDIPSPPSSSKNRRRRFSMSSTASRPLRDLTSDPNFENTDRSSKEQGGGRSDQRRRSENKRSRNSLCHVESPLEGESKASTASTENPSSSKTTVDRAYSDAHATRGDYDNRNMRSRHKRGRGAPFP